MTEGTEMDPWKLKTPPGSSAYTMYRDPEADPAALVCQVGSTTLTYHLRSIDDLHAWLVEQGDWVLLERPTRRNRRCPARSRDGVGRPTTRWGVGTGCARGTGAASACTSHRSWKRSVWPN